MDLWEAILRAISLVITGSPDLWHVIGTTFKVSGLALGISTLIGIPVGAVMGLTHFPTRRIWVALIYTGMGFPPVVVGLGVYLVLSRSGPLGDLALLFTPWAMITAQVVLAFPLITGLTMTAIEAVDPQVGLEGRSLGADRIQEVRLTLREARGGVVAAIVAGFGGIISEVGAAMLVGGNIEGQTRVLSTAIVLETRQGAFGLALALGGVLLSLSFVVNILFLLLQGRAKRRPWR
jgi:tungstate transport system permease protein